MIQTGLTYIKYNTSLEDIIIISKEFYLTRGKPDSSTLLDPNKGLKLVGKATLKPLCPHHYKCSRATCLNSMK